MNERGGRRLRNAILRFAVMVLLLVAAFFLYRESGLSERLGAEQITAMVETVRGWWWSPLALIGLWTALSPLGLPATPLLLAGGVIFGPWLGTLYNIIGATLGGVAAFLFARVLGRDLILHLLSERSLARVERLLDHYGFSSLVSIRLVPIPFVMVNFGAALAGVPFGTFFLSTAIGMVPMVFVLTFFYATLGNLTTGPDRGTLIWLVAALVLMSGLALLRLYLRGRSGRQQS